MILYVLVIESAKLGGVVNQQLPTFLNLPNYNHEGFLIP